MLVDSWYDPYLGVVALVRIQNGRLAKGQKIRMMATGKAYQVDRVGVFTPARTEIDALGPGEIGFITASIKAVADCQVGDTVTDDRQPVAAPLPGFKPITFAAVEGNVMTSSGKSCIPFSLIVMSTVSESERLPESYTVN